MHDNVPKGMWTRQTDTALSNSAPVIFVWPAEIDLHMELMSWMAEVAGIQFELFALCMGVCSLVQFLCGIPEHIAFILTHK